MSAAMRYPKSSCPHISVVSPGVVAFETTEESVLLSTGGDQIEEGHVRSPILGR
jgi:hypothetical protein